MIWFLVSFVSIYDKGYLEIIDFFSTSKVSPSDSISWLIAYDRSPNAELMEGLSIINLDPLIFKEEPNLQLDKLNFFLNIYMNMVSV